MCCWLLGSSNSKKQFSFLLAASACIGGFLFGYDTGVISGALLLIDDDFNLDDTEKELVVSITIAGAFLAASLAGWLSNVRGRKFVIVLGSVVFAIGAIVMAVATGLAALVIGRLVIGLGVGFASAVVPCYLSETSPTRTRGFLATFMNLSIVVGQLVASIVAGSFSEVSGGWRYMLGLAALPAIIQFFTFVLVMPESPSWLVMKGRLQEAGDVLRMIRDPTEDDVDAELESLRHARYGDGAGASATDDTTDRKSRNDIQCSDGNDSLEPVNDLRQGSNGQSLLGRPSKGGGDSNGGSSSSSGRGVVSDGNDVSFLEMFGSTTTRRALLVGCGLQACQQLAGINTIMYYSATLLKLAGFTSTKDAIWLSAVVALCNVLGSIGGVLAVEKYGRRPLTLASLVGVTLFLAAISVAFYAAQQTSGRLHGADGNDGHCSEYKWGLDCVEDDECGICERWDDDVRDVCAAGSEDDGPDDKARCSGFHADTTPEGTGASGWAILCCLCGYLLAFGPGLGSMPWTVNSEIYVREHRALANSLSTSTNWICNFAIAMSFLSLATALTKHGAFALYACVTAGFGLFFYKYLPEPKGLPIEVVPDLFLDQRWGKYGK